MYRYETEHCVMYASMHTSRHTTVFAHCSSRSTRLDGTLFVNCPMCQGHETRLTDSLWCVRVVAWALGWLQIYVPGMAFICKTGGAEVHAFLTGIMQDGMHSSRNTKELAPRRTFDRCHAQPPALHVPASLAASMSAEAPLQSHSISHSAPM